MRVMYIVGWEFLDPSMEVAIAMMDLKLPFEKKWETNVHTAALERHHRLDVGLLNWIKSLGFDPNGSVRTWMEVYTDA